MKKLKCKIEDIINPRSPNFKVAFGIIQDRIPLGERSDIADFAETLDQAADRELYPDNYHMLVAVTDSVVVGVVTGYYISEINMGFVNNLAVREDYSRLGIATDVRSQLITRFKRDSVMIGRRNLDGVLGEVEKQNRWLIKTASDPNVFVFDIKYFQPPLREGQDRRELALYVQCDKARKRFHRKTLINILRAIYGNIYDKTGIDRDKLFIEMLQSFENRTYISRKTI